MVHSKGLKVMMGVGKSEVVHHHSLSQRYGRGLTAIKF